MNKKVFLLLLTGLLLTGAQAQVCDSIIEDFEGEYENETSYDVLAKKGEAYKKAGSCYTEKEREAKAKESFRKAAQHYEKAGNEMNAPAKSDYEIKGKLFRSSAEIYLKIGEEKNAENAYMKAMNAFEEAGYQQGKEDVQTSLMMVRGEGTPVSNFTDSPGESSQLLDPDVSLGLSLAITGVVLAGVGMVIIHLWK